MKLIIRPIKEKDNTALAKMIRAVFIEHDAPQEGTVYSDTATDDLFNYYKEKNAIGWVAEENNLILGCCGIYPTGNLPKGCIELVKFYLPKEARGKGIGKNLMDKCINSAKELGYKQLYIESIPHFSKAISIYEKQGFKLLNQRLGMSGHDSCNIWLLKEL
jgi:putative acetyltransferase